MLRSRGSPGTMDQWSNTCVQKAYGANRASRIRKEAW
jgi:hypothetical protein